MSETTTEIKDGIEWFGPDRQESQCARCGSSTAWADCHECDSEGYVERDFGDDVIEDLHSVVCGFCRGRGGSWHCVSPPEFCEANPIAGREEIRSTARSSEWWSDE